MAAKKKQKRHATPVGEIVMGFIQKPSTKYSDDPHGEYTVKLAYTGNEPGFAEFKEFLEKVSAKAHAKMIEEDPRNKNFRQFEYLKPEEDDEGNPTGRVIFNATQTASWKDGNFRKLPVFDNKLQPWAPDLLIGNGSKASLSFSLGAPYAHLKITGAKPWLQAVMIEDFVEYTGGQDGASFGFTATASDDDDDIFGDEGESSGGSGGDNDFDY